MNDKPVSRVAPAPISAPVIVPPAPVSAASGPPAAPIAAPVAAPVAAPAPAPAATVGFTIDAIEETSNCPNTLGFEPAPKTKPKTPPPLFS